MGADMNEFVFEDYGKIVLGMHCDDVLAMIPRKRFAEIQVVGRDDDGLIVEWRYDNNLVLTFAYTIGYNPVTNLQVGGYFVLKMEIRNDDSSSDS